MDGRHVSGDARVGAVIINDENDHIDLVLEDANSAPSVAKRPGGERAVLFEPLTRRDAQQRARLGAELEVAPAQWCPSSSDDFAGCPERRSDKLLVDACSANTARYLGQTPAAVLGKGIRALFGDGAERAHNCLHSVGTKAKQFCPAFFRNAGGRPFGHGMGDVLLTATGERLVAALPPSATVPCPRSPMP